MNSAITRGIQVSVETFYQPEYSYPMGQHFMFAYRIIISNQSDMPVQLLRRHWFITDGTGQQREVEGEGVVGEQPVLQPGQSYQYVSGCDFKTEIGKMHGTYLMQKIDDGKIFYITIPEFVMVTPMKLN
jgi:ApaG protein